MGLLPKIPGLDVGAAVAQFRSVMEGIAADTARNQANTQHIAGHLMAINARLDEFAGRLAAIERELKATRESSHVRQTTVTVTEPTEPELATIAHIGRPAA